MTRVTFSDNTVNVDLPKGWTELTQRELVTVLSCLDFYSGPDDDPRMQIFLRLSGLTLQRKVKPDKDGRYKFVVPIKGGPSRVVWLSPAMVVSVLSELNWIYEPGDQPVRLDSLLGCPAVNARMRSLPFADWLKAENLYQAFISTQDYAHIKSLERILYPGIKDSDMWLTGRAVNMVNWITQVKAMFARMFPHLYRPAKDDGSAPNMLEIMNNQIRILTGGDVTKEQAVMESDCWRALTELDYKAVEAEELKSKLNKK